MSEAPGSVEDVVAALDEQTAADARALMQLMHGITGCEPALWNVSTIGYDSYHYRYDSGRQGDCHALGFNARKGRITIYLMDGTAPHADLLGTIGPHTTSKVCVYLKRLDGIDLDALAQVLRASYDYVKAHDGHMHRA